MAIEPLIKDMPPKRRERLAFAGAALLGLVALLWGLNVYVLRGHRIDRAAAQKAELALVQQLRNGDLNQSAETLQRVTREMPWHYAAHYNLHVGPEQGHTAGHPFRVQPLRAGLPSGYRRATLVGAGGCGHRAMDTAGRMDRQWAGRTFRGEAPKRGRCHGRTRRC